MHPRRPLRKRKTVEMLVWLTLLCWATQTMLAQWGYGQTFHPTPTARPDRPPATDAPRPEAPDQRALPEAPETHFVADPSRLINATVELRSEASVYGAEVRLRQIARWSDADATTVGPLGDLVLARLSEKAPFARLTTDDVKRILHDAGVNQAMLRFAGATACTVSRADVAFDEGDAMRKWMNVHGKNSEERATDESTSMDRVDAPDGVTLAEALATSNVRPEAYRPGRLSDPVVEQARALEPLPDDRAPVGTRALRAVLVDDLATRLGLPPASLQLTFNPKDEKLLGLSEPQFRFNVEPKRARALGDVSWDVLIVTEAGQHKATVAAGARAWQDQVVVARPVPMKGVIREEDLSARRVLTDRVAGDALPAARHAIGQQASRDLRAGEVVTARMVQAVPLVRTGQLVTVTIAQGGIRVKTVARAAEPGTFGQTIKVKNETTRTVYDVTVTGPQAAIVGDAEVAAAAVGP